MPVTFVNGSLPAKDFEKITISSVALGFTASKLVVGTAINARGGDSGFIDVKRMDEAFITAETDQIRFRIDGTAPTSAIGHLLNPGDSIVISGYGNLANFQAICVTTDAVLQITYYRKG